MIYIVCVYHIHSNLKICHNLYINIVCASVRVHACVNIKLSHKYIFNCTGFLQQPRVSVRKRKLGPDKVLVHGETGFVRNTVHWRVQRRQTSVPGKRSRTAEWSRHSRGKLEDRNCLPNLKILMCNEYTVCRLEEENLPNKVTILFPVTSHHSIHIWWHSLQSMSLRRPTVDPSDRIPVSGRNFETHLIKLYFM